MENRAKSIVFEVINGPIPLALAVSIFDLDLTECEPTVRFGLLSVDRPKFAELFGVTEEVVTSNWQSIRFTVKVMELRRGQSQWRIWGMIWLDATKSNGAYFEGIYRDRRTGHFTAYIGIGEAQFT